jgi:dienelactone hydrolase
MNFDLSLFDTADYRNFRVQNTSGEFNWNTAQMASLSTFERLQWQGAFRERFGELLGDLCNWERPPLEAQIVESRQMDGYRRESVVFTTRPGLRAVAYLLVPDDCHTPRPAVLCIPGHGRGVDSLVGIAPDGTQRPLNQPDEYQADFALQCVARGYVVLALEPISFGHRRDAETRERSAEASTCNRDAMAALMLGETLPGWRVWDAMRALDYLQTRSDVVDGERLAMMGISGGGLVTLFTAALDERVSIAVVSGYFNTFAASILGVDHCSDNYVPGLLRLCEMPDLAALVAPRALFVESGHKDDIFPLPAFETAVGQAREIYQVFGASKYFEAETFPAGHQFHGAGAFPFLDQWRDNLIA